LARRYHVAADPHVEQEELMLGDRALCPLGQRREAVEWTTTPPAPTPRAMEAKSVSGSALAPSARAGQAP